VKGRWVGEGDVQKEEGMVKMALVNQLGFEGMNGLVD